MNGVSMGHGFIMACGLLGLIACGGEFGQSLDALDGGAQAITGTAEGGTLFNNADASGIEVPEGGISDGTPGLDAFFINDAPPPVCGPDGGMSAAMDPGGTPECPGDKNRAGCPCDEPGTAAACWPGKRINRNRGICQDGTALCESDPEFGPRWSLCEGYVRPAEGATEGAQACRCFSNGIWAVDNLVPCLHTTDNRTFLYSSRLDLEGKPACETVDSTPPPVPSEAWARTSLKVDCEGQFRLCFSIKAGDMEAPKQSDCPVMKQCVDVWYAEAGRQQDLPDLGPWSSQDGDCGTRFVDEGGYGEMTVQGLSVECDPVDDGEGAPFVFRRTRYCPASCAQAANANKPECANCQTGGSGMFGP